MFFHDSFLCLKTLYHPFFLPGGGKEMCLETCSRCNFRCKELQETKRGINKVNDLFVMKRAVYPMYIVVITHLAFTRSTLEYMELVLQRSRSIWFSVCGCMTHKIRANFTARRLTVEYEIYIAFFGLKWAHNICLSADTFDRYRPGFSVE